MHVSQVKICTIADKNKKSMTTALNTHNMDATLEAFTDKNGEKGWRVLIPFNHQIFFREQIIPFYTALSMIDNVSATLSKTREHISNGR